jgi:Swt1-like HEPN/Phage integrase family
VATVNSVLDKYKKEELPRLKASTRKGYAALTRLISREFGHRRLGSLTKPELDAWMKATKSAFNRNRAMTVFKTALDAAVRWGWIEHNVCSTVQRNPKSEKRARVLTEKEFERAKQIARIPKLTLLMDLAWHTGMLQGVLIDLSWRQVYYSERVIRARDPRTEEIVEVQFTPEIEDILRKCKEIKSTRKSDTVVPTKSGKPYTHAGFRAFWQRLMDEHVKGGNARFTFHDIRKTYQERLKQTAVVSGVSSIERIFQDHPNFDKAIQREAITMAPYYAVFYALENTIRKIVETTLETKLGADWWNTDEVHQEIKLYATALVRKERESGVRLRSPHMIDYTTFGHLIKLVEQNWSLFEDVFKDQKGFSKVMANLNMSRGPIAHSCMMNVDEADRLKLHIRDFFDQSIT